MSNFETCTMEHKARVSILLTKVAKELIRRGNVHDNSKFKTPERELYEMNHDKLDTVKFGTEEYRKLHDEMSVAIEHHYKENDHHPEHFKDGIVDMDLLQIMEMLADISAVAKTKGTDVVAFLPDFMREKNIPENFYTILRNTLEHMKGFG